MTSNELYYQTARDTIDYQNSLHTEFSIRAANLLSLGLAGMAVVGFVLNARLGKFDWTPFFIFSVTCFLVGFVIVTYFAIFGILRTRRWYAFPRPKALRKMTEHSAFERRTERVRKALANYMNEAARKNEPVLAAKAKAMFRTIIGLALEIVGLIFVVFSVFEY